MRTHVFDVEGSLALFRKPYSPVSPVSFPFPTPPAIMGIVGAICGYEKDDCLEMVGWDRVKVGVGIRAPVKRLRAGINLLNTKVSPFHNAKGGRIQIPHEFLKDVKFRVWVADGNNEMMDNLGRHLRDGTNAYTVSLGLAQCLASVHYIATVDAKRLPVEEHAVISVVPLSDDIKIVYEPGKVYGHYRVPVRMAPGRKVVEYRVVVAEEGGNATRVNSPDVWQIGDDRVLFL